MAVTFSVAVLTAMANQIQTIAGGSAKLTFFSGSQPAAPASANTGTLLATITLPATFLTAASGATALAGTWSNTATNTGTAGYFRIFDGSANCHVQGIVGYSSANGNWAASTAYTVGNTVVNGTNVYIVTVAGTSGSSGGPTGTGTGITDGTVTWNYVGAVGDMNIPNPAFSTGEVITINSFVVTVT